MILTKAFSEIRILLRILKGKDDTLFALIDGKVKFHRLGKARKQVSIEAQS